MNIHSSIREEPFSSGACFGQSQHTTIKDIANLPYSLQAPEAWKKLKTLVLSGNFPEVTGPLCAQIDGFSLHAGVYCRPWERDKLEKLCRYVARPAVAEERLSMLGNGNIVYKLKKPYWDGTSHLLFSPQEFMEKLAALVPLPRAHLTRFSGILAPHAKSRKDVVPKAKAVPSGKDGEPKEEKPKRQRMTWAKLLRRVFKMDVETCHACGGKMQMIAAILERKVIRQILAHRSHEGITESNS